MRVISEAAKIVGLAEYFIRQLVLKGKIKYVRSGRKYLLNMDSLINYLTNGEAVVVVSDNSVKNIQRRYND